MTIDILTIFPEMFDSVLSASILGRARANGLLDISATDIRPFSASKHKNTDDYPFGGGAGMLMMAQPIADAMKALCARRGLACIDNRTGIEIPHAGMDARESAGDGSLGMNPVINDTAAFDELRQPENVFSLHSEKGTEVCSEKELECGMFSVSEQQQSAISPEKRSVKQETLPPNADFPEEENERAAVSSVPVASCVPGRPRAKRIYLSPRGVPLTQKLAQTLAQEEALILLCGHYEGVDQRVLDKYIDLEISVGDYVLTGGEVAAMVLVDCVARLVPGVLGSAESPQDESFSDAGLLEYPQYTRPRVFEDMEVPSVLLNGDHAKIAAWRREQAISATQMRRPELLSKAALTPKEREKWG